MTIRYTIVKITGTEEVRKAARVMRRALNQLRHFFDSETLPLSPPRSMEFDGKSKRYKKIRNKFTELILADLDRPRRRAWGKWRAGPKGERYAENEETAP